MSFLSPRTFCLFALISLMALQTGCATQEAAKKAVVWHSRDQFVALVDRDERGEKAPPNQHPVSLSDKRLHSELAALRVKFPNNPKQVRVFDEPEVKLLTEQLPAALQKARPDQDVVFAVYGRNPVLAGIGSEEVVTTGRAFYRENRLNLILGMLREQIRELDRRLQPFVPPSRGKGVELPGVVTSTSSKVTFAAQRPDWLVIAVPEASAEAALAPEPEVAGAPVKVAPVAAKDFEERLRVLGELKAKGLITEDEYRAKKESILKEL
ncbi:SHOCT domain-containing protein [Geomonas sp. RF6]|uniref:SHOCT domain-containing protein n=1 Tax=Geomonas sp. RF6 TaxID=2897342 RepID=UPI001E4E7793|nr:SHOCT domain-containing protein [Geomonas sp. RF6]UFS69177.1 SHOCT domain-containing protein [Geomonas sp. RF6]